MTVKQLIEWLEKSPPDAVIYTEENKLVVASALTLTKLTSVQIGNQYEVD